MSSLIIMKQCHTLYVRTSVHIPNSTKPLIVTQIAETIKTSVTVGKEKQYIDSSERDLQE